MKLSRSAPVFVLLALVIQACSQSENSIHKSTEKFTPPEIQLSESHPGGDTTVSTVAFPSLMKPAKNLPQKRLPEFHAGKALAHQPWVKAPTITTARDGLGPVYNARTCLACHMNGGRGQMPTTSDIPLLSAILRLSIPGEDEVHGVIPEPVYGDQLQTQSVALSHQLRSNTSVDDFKYKEVAPEAYLYVNWLKSQFEYADGVKVELRKPEVRFTNLGYGKMHPQTLTSLRVAPPIHGAGLLEAISQQDINANVDPDDNNGDGISGRVNQVWDFETKKTVPGRFGLKANKANLRTQVAGAFAGDVGISNPLFPEQSCTTSQVLCQKTPDGNDVSSDGSPAVELPELLLKLVTDFNRNIGVPERRNLQKKSVKNGRNLFYQAGCANCHQPSYVTQKVAGFEHLSTQTIWPYTDLLLHDMGEQLADGRPDYLATGNEWRTPPLWGVGLRKLINGSDNLLHDGRAQTVEEAILWHGGEAEKSKLYFVRLSSEQRLHLVAFVNSL